MTLPRPIQWYHCIILSRSNLAGRRTVPLRWSRHVDKSTLLNSFYATESKLGNRGKTCADWSFQILRKTLHWFIWFAKAAQHFGQNRSEPFFENLLCKNFIKKLIKNLRGTAGKLARNSEWRQQGWNRFCMMLHVWIALFCLTGEDEPLGFAHPQFLKPTRPAAAFSL